MKRIGFINPDDYEPGEEISLSEDIELAIKCLDRSKINPRNWRPLSNAELTTAELAMKMMENVMLVPSGMLVGKRLKFMFFQEVILYIIFDAKPSTFVLSLARRNGKTFLLAVVVLLNLISDLAARNSTIASAAMSRDQAALVYKEIDNFINVSPVIKPFIKTVASSKRLIGVVRNAEYQALAAEAKTGFGRSFKIVVLDEAGQIVGPTNDYISMLQTSQGSIEDPLFSVISTQASSDSDYLSVMIDTAIRDQPKDTAVLVFETPKHYGIDDEEGWFYSNPGLGEFRSLKDMRKQAASAKMIPQNEARFRNLNLNQRIALQGLWISPTIWRSCSDEPDINVFRDHAVSLGLDLSLRTDLTAAVFAAEDDAGCVHIIPLVFLPLVGIEQRELRDKAPYQYWVENGYAIGVPAAIIEYEWVAQYLLKWCVDHNVEPTSIEFDRWRIDVMKREFDKLDAFQGAEWNPVGQGYRDISPRVEHFEAKLFARKIKHAAHPLLNLGAASAVAVSDPAGNRKLEKAKSSQRIDMIIAAIMAVYGLKTSELIDVDAWIG
jgi:phage terminase large subunit-like protein